MEACFIPTKYPLPLNTVYYIPVKTEDMGYLLSGYLNSAPVRQYCRKRAELALGDYRRYFAWLIASVPWPFPCVCQDQIVTLSKTLHSAPHNKSAMEQLDAAIMQLWSHAKATKHVSILDYA